MAGPGQVKTSLLSPFEDWKFWLGIGYLIPMRATGLSKAADRKFNRVGGHRELD
jgi:hypothetical protein